MLLESYYSVFLGGVPDDVTVVADALPTKSPYIGCIRDVIIETSLTQLNNIPYHTAGIEMGVCSAAGADLSGRPDSGSDSEPGQDTSETGQQAHRSKETCVTEQTSYLSLNLWEN